MEFKLSLLGTFPDQSLYKRGQVGDEQQHSQALFTVRTGNIQAQPDPQILGVAKRLLNAHPLRAQPGHGIGQQLLRVNFFVQRDRTPFNYHAGTQQLPALIQA